jgi:hypothetical protein
VFRNQECFESRFSIGFPHEDSYFLHKASIDKVFSDGALGDRNRPRFDNSPLILTFERTQPSTTMPHIAYKKALVLATETVVAQDILKA